MFTTKMQKNEFGQLIDNIVENWSPRKIPVAKEINGKFCLLKPLYIDEHGMQLFKAFQQDNNGEIYTYLPFGPFADYDGFIKWLYDASISKICFTIIDLITNTPQGIASFHDIDVNHGIIEVGSIIYSKSLQRTVAATEAMYLLMHEVFDIYQYRRYQWRCNALNQPSRRAAERLGFKFEGIFRQHYVFKEHNRDTAWFSIIDSEWPNIKHRFEKWLSYDNFYKDGNQILHLKDIT